MSVITVKSLMCLLDLECGDGHLRLRGHVPPCVGLPARARTLRKSACGIHDRTCNRTEDRAPRAQGLYTAGARLVLRATVRVVISGERLGEFARIRALIRAACFAFAFCPGWNCVWLCL